MTNNCPFEAWQLIQAQEILKWMRAVNNYRFSSESIIIEIEDTFFNIAHNKLGLKPIGKCTIQELQQKLKRRGL